MLAASSGDKTIDQKYLESVEMGCWRRMEKIGWTDRVRNEEVLRRVKDERKILHTVKRGKANRIGHIWRRNCLLKQGTEGEVEGRVEGTGRRGRRSKQLLDDLKETREYWTLKEEALDRTLWRTGFGRGTTVLYAVFWRHNSAVCCVFRRHNSTVCCVFVRYKSAVCCVFVRHKSAVCCVFMRHKSAVCCVFRR
jgi:hypothetical protein